ncbi:MAG: hypothetical protein CMJ23_08350 [Phycisphaerae bacterium]|nr:hypothetical protein [Phycisphaerae bacterium]
MIRFGDGADEIESSVALLSLDSMAKPKRKKKKPGSGRPAVAFDLDAVLVELDEVRASLSAERVGPEWGAMQRLLVKAKADSSSVARAIATRDLELIDQLIALLRDPSLVIAEPESNIHEGPEIPVEVLRDAMRAYRKRMKLTKLDQESKLARSPLSSGKDATFDAIIPPNQFPPEVWWALVANGELEATGEGFYKIPDQRREF